MSKEKYSSEDTLRSKEWLSHKYPGLPVLSADGELSEWHSELSSSLIHNIMKRPSDILHAPEHPFISWVWSHINIVNSERLKSILKNMPRSVVRIKGWILTERGLRLVQYAGRFVRLSQVTPTVKIEEGLVVISTRDTHPQDINKLLQYATE
ncbi:TPA: GTP-binding protein [Salmonella enterica subsp. enterica serovar Oranienburg]|nr:hypothetical protein [Salmonella enterica]EKB5042449.1 GTP-binding protein [Salmonella enterica]EME1067524.1 GTP-binding protein [Salmonella enterica]HEC8685119.1 GTP-binding protein [Salmonella enterica subsp. enterica serovar Oranienburg]HEC9416457.1 GTP-binding protein [Salmonella enterica subsp. enterica serovar Poona]